MSKGVLSRKKGQFQATVTHNVAFSRRFYRLGLELVDEPARLFAAVAPGQFIQIDAANLALPEPGDIPENLLPASDRRIMLRRPFSFSDIVAHGQKQTSLEILYCVLGPATLRMTTLKRGSHLNIVGPLGNGFSVPKGKRTALLVAGGMGAPPLQHLARVLARSLPHVKVLVFAGAASAADLPFTLRSKHISSDAGLWFDQLAEYNIESIVATEDGSAGFVGLITDSLAIWLRKNVPSTNDTVIYTCGPEVMMAKVAQMANEASIDCYASLERMMGCGIGVCQSCAVECTQPDSAESVYKLCCRDGPVFDTRNIIWGGK